MYSLVSEKAIEARARRAASRVGLVARKSRRRRDSLDNFGRFMLINQYTNCIVAGERFDMTAEEVLDYCSG